jgi:hypothetical protein
LQSVVCLASWVLMHVSLRPVTDFWC